MSPAFPSALQEPSRWLPVAKLLRPQGRRGELLAEPLSDLNGIFDPGNRFSIERAPSGIATTTSEVSETSVTLDTSWRPQGRNAGRIVLKLVGIDSISAAEAFIGSTLLLPEDKLPALEADTFLVRDLVGCLLLDGQKIVGTVTDLQFPVGADGRSRLPDTADLLVVSPFIEVPPAETPDPSDAASSPEELLVPFVKAWLVSVDLQSRTITMTLPEGLLASG